MDIEKLRQIFIEFLSSPTEVVIFFLVAVFLWLLKTFFAEKIKKIANQEDDNKDQRDTKENQTNNNSTENANNEIAHRISLSRREITEPDSRSTPNASRILPLTVPLSSGTAYGENLYTEFENLNARQVAVQVFGINHSFLAILDDLVSVDKEWQNNFNKPDKEKIIREELLLLLHKAEQSLS